LAIEAAGVDAHQNIKIAHPPPVSIAALIYEALRDRLTRNKESITVEPEIIAQPALKKTPNS
jgi:hypothetical protein